MDLRRQNCKLLVWPLNEWMWSRMRAYIDTSALLYLTPRIKRPNIRTKRVREIKMASIHTRQLLDSATYTEPKYYVKEKMVY